VKIIYVLFVFLISCSASPTPADKPAKKIAEINHPDSVSLIILGIAQDAGAPQISCKKDCCKNRFGKSSPKEKVVSLGLIDQIENHYYLFEATPDIVEQMNNLLGENKSAPNGIFLTHAHMGHYSGLIHLGKEAMNAQKVPIYAMPRMREFIQTNGPWSQLVTNNNIALQDLKDQEAIELSAQLKVKPFLVPHRDEYSETVGYKIFGPNKSALFIPDIDKWHLWDKDISLELKKVDYAFIDATFYDAAEINNRDISQIPHPFVIESMERFDSLPITERQKIVFIHLNHTNPLLKKQSKKYQLVLAKGYRVANELDSFDL